MQNPLRYIDPTGHTNVEADEWLFQVTYSEEVVLRQWEDDFILFNIPYPYPGIVPQFSFFESIRMYLLDRQKSLEEEAVKKHILEQATKSIPMPAVISVVVDVSYDYLSQTDGELSDKDKGLINRAIYEWNQACSSRHFLPMMISYQYWEVASDEALFSNIILMTFRSATVSTNPYGMAADWLGLVPKFKTLKEGDQILRITVAY